IGGICYANVLFLTPDISHIGLKAFPAAILGGLDSIPGAIVGGIIIGVCETLASGYLDQMVGGGIKEITSFIILIAILMIKPYGLFGKEKITRV
ncbi:MAG: branched-chain amino acid ABC transporter permease, partial [Deltaproteobacteria bacterium]|nr:branched-chain amino acid ABC transporter permease [Deltaproteobacteria bacterium]